MKNGFTSPTKNYDAEQVRFVVNAQRLLRQPLIRQMLQYSLPIVLSATALAIASVLNSALPGYVRFTFLICTIVTTLWGGLGPGLIAAFLSAVLIDYFFIQPTGTLFSQIDSFFLLAIFIAIPLLITSIKESRDRSEQVWRETKFQLEAILQGFSDGILAQDLDGQPIFANEVTARYLGYGSVKQMLETPITEMHNWFDAYDEDGNIAGLKMMPRKKTVETGKNHELTLRLRHRTTGEDRWIVFKSALICDNQQKPRLTVTILQDISTRKKEEQERLKLLLMVEGERRRVQNILDNVPGIVWETQVNAVERTQKFVFVNDSVKKILGYNASEWLEDPEIGLKFTHPDDLAYVTQRVVEIYNGTRSGSLEYRVFHKDGHIVPIEAHMTIEVDSNQLPIAIYGVFMDITERKQAEEERLKLLKLVDGERQRVQNILDNVPGVVCETKIDPEHHTQIFVFVSDYVKQMLGYNPEDWLNNPYIENTIVYPDDIPYVTEQLAAIYEGGKSNIEFRMRHTNGKVIPIEASMTLMKDNAGIPTGICGVFMDITERKQAEEKLSRYALDLQRSNEELQRFAYVASHDLQEPLRMVASYLQLIESRYADKLDADAHDFIAYAVDGATRMKALINGLLAYSRVETQPQNFVPIDCQEVLEEVKGILGMALEETGAVITSDPLPQIKADERLILPLFQNLVSNALKYRSTERKPEIHIGVERQKDHWLFSVRDNGIGIESQYLEQVFVIFQRLHARDRYTGMGIGLAICKKVVERHHGRIWVESEIGKGSTFYFTIPS